ncbi:serine hydrolase [uncultured Ramlibacter sp.]|uniref:serine hydrolase domain-containing protein n=1 Tax=uncultured Ramlibacter sp. TaxID=260755 RepID=UPI00261EBFCB|nr:serine hydrolase [uncultured Ramlibacter sp.]
MRHPLLACALILSSLAGHAQPAPTPWPTTQWSTATPESQGLDPGALAGLFDYLATPAFNTDSVLVVRHGRIVAEAYAAPFRAGLRHDLRSVTKSVVATLVGTALQEGKLASDQQKVLSFFPQHPANGPGQEALTLRHLLDMRAGIQWRETPYDAQSDAVKMWSAPDMAGYILALPVAAPGESFLYSGAAPHLLSVVLSRSTGANAADYARGGLFKTLGINDFRWIADRQGHSVGESSLFLAPRDMARIGLLHLRRGQWEGKQLLPAGWTEALLNEGAPPPGPPPYRSLWWLDTTVPFAAALGRHNQAIVLLPKQDMMLVLTSKTADTTRGPRAGELVRNHLLHAVKSDAALPEDSAAQAQLAQAMQRFALRADPSSQTPSPAALAQSRRSHVLEPNAWGYREFALDLGASQPSYRLLQADSKAFTGQSTRGGPMGLDGRYVESTRANDKLWARRGRWVDETTFRIETQHLEAAFVAEWTARFLGDGKLELLYANGDGDTLLMHGRVKE